MKTIHELGQILQEYCENMQEYWHDVPDWMVVLVLMVLAMLLLKRYLKV